MHNKSAEVGIGIGNAIYAALPVQFQRHRTLSVIQASMRIFTWPLVNVLLNLELSARLGRGRSRIFDGAGDQSKVRQSIDILNSAGVAHVPAMRTLRELMTKIWHRNVWAEPLEQPIGPILPGAATLRAGQPNHVQLGRGLAERIRSVVHSKPFIAT
jgi:hypothetical protein